MDPNQGLCLGALFDIAATNVIKSCAIYLFMKRLDFLTYTPYACKIGS